MPKVVPPVVGHDDQFFWDGVKEGRLLIRKCAKCGRLQHPPSPMCPNCGSLEWDVQESSGKGTVHSWILSHHPTQPDEAPRIVALVELDEGIRLVSNLQDVEPDAVRNDMAVQVTFAELDAFDGGKVTLPQFRPA